MILLSFADVGEFADELKLDLKEPEFAPTVLRVTNRQIVLETGAILLQVVASYRNGDTVVQVVQDLGDVGEGQEPTERERIWAKNTQLLDLLEKVAKAANMQVRRGIISL